MAVLFNQEKFIKNLLRKAEELDIYDEVSYELDVFKKRDLIEYLFIFSKFVESLDKNDIPTVLRRTGGSSYIAYLLGINKINPKEYDLTNYLFVNQDEIRFDICVPKQYIQHAIKLLGDIDYHKTKHSIYVLKDSNYKVGVFAHPALERIVNLEKETWNEQQKLNAVLEPLKQYEKDKQEKLYYTIQTPEEYREDINFLLTNVSPKIQHPDILNKLIWNEYIKPYITDTFTRIDIKEVPGIYKLTNLDSGKAYIGKSTNVKKRITDHFKAAIGINNIAWQAVHDEILKTGFWNWSIEVIIYCDQKDLNDLEKYYIEFFKTQEFGYNKTQGG